MPLSPTATLAIGEAVDRSLVGVTVSRPPPPPPPQGMNYNRKAST
jgi:hypothetical protein